MTPKTPLDTLELPREFQRALQQNGLLTVGQLLRHYPRRHEDRRSFGSFPLGGSGGQALCLYGVVTDAQRRFLRGRGRSFFEATLTSPDNALTPPLILRWFNLPFIHKLLATGQHLVVYGKVKESGKRLVLDHPDYEIVEPDSPDSSLHMRRIVPIYPLKEGLKQRPLRALLARVLESLPLESLAELVPPAFQKGDILSLGQAIRGIHFPDDPEHLAQSRHRLARDEFLALQLNVLRQRARLRAHQKPSRAGPGELTRELLASLPFKLTGAQQRSVEEIRRDLASTCPMNRLLQGDVGSGKTLVALASMLYAVESGWQAALMAPTQILAEQHYLNFEQWLAPLGIRVGLRTGSKKSSDSLPLLEGGGEPQILVGTHALLWEKEAFAKLGYVVIDEQHKFGVLQRGRLTEKAEEGQHPDLLVMTATPIPRTLTLTVYGDLDVSLIDELPQGRGKIVTAVRPGTRTKEAAKFVKEHLEQDRQAYLVFPLVEESEKVSAKAATQEVESWSRLLHPHEVGLLHGRLSAEEKQATMDAFRQGRLGALVSTTVIEVGVDVPNANVMLVFDAERFGLAQLHQLRGRIGRGAHKSYCILLTGKKAGDEAAEKLAVLEDTTDGFRVAEADLELRGAGEILGTAQSGHTSGLRLGNLVSDTALVHEARALAQSILAADPDLSQPEHRLLKKAVRRVEANFS
ncbi:MAG: ATP-dependent DNA helicase RecG [Verrucomicrobiota bacterium]